MWSFKKKRTGIDPNFWLVPEPGGCSCPACVESKEVAVRRWWDDMMPNYATINGKPVICPYVPASLTVVIIIG